MYAVRDDSPHRVGLMRRLASRCVLPLMYLSLCSTASLLLSAMLLVPADTFTHVALVDRSSINNEAAGGLVMQVFGVWRVNGVLSVARAFGDHNLKVLRAMNGIITDTCMIRTLSIMINQSSMGVFELIGTHACPSLLPLCNLSRMSSSPTRISASLTFRATRISLFLHVMACGTSWLLLT